MADYTADAKTKTHWSNIPASSSLPADAAARRPAGTMNRPTPWAGEAGSSGRWLRSTPGTWWNPWRISACR